MGLSAQLYQLSSAVVSYVQPAVQIKNYSKNPCVIKEATMKTTVNYSYEKVITKIFL